MSLARVKDRHIDGGLGRIERAAVLGVQEAGIAAGQVHRPPPPLQPGRAEIEHPLNGEFSGKLRALRPRQKHRVAEVGAAALAGEHVGEEDALVDLQPVLVALPAGRLRRELLSTASGRDGFAGGRDKLIEPHEARPATGQAVIDGAPHTL